ncbi:hypothetical protein VB638_10705 [Dolichospermum sp. UHCC 0684]|uniref:hypothetical protein n=1 Tax=unclassified Dolichospermum TaxID=2622029 RepID=UPI0014469095|nr:MULTISPECIES: hypothetical protein [unclassified Dolichospermum]MEA5530050.1 hypothetical protein [Dolichospermum sp. UHCC 0684]MTJ34599.1 hypothetical protein [Dolichospermum sp. UHCC 0260]
MSFIQALDEVYNQVTDELQRRYNRPLQNIPFNLKLYYAVQSWTVQLKISENENITNFILRNSQLDAVIELTKYLRTESITEKKSFEIPSPLGNFKLFHTDNEFYDRVNSFLSRMSIRSDNMKVIVIIAFVITAVGYWLYIINRQKEQTQQPQQPTRRPETRQNEYVFTSPSPPVQTPPVQRIKQVLVLVISASQIDFLNSISAKRQISFSEGEQLYELTKYLWTGSEIDYQQRISNINRYSVSQGEESEYDIHLVYIELKLTDSGFNPTVNQLDRYDAFRKLSDLAVDFKISPRLQMEAYGNFEVYSR